MGCTSEFEFTPSTVGAGDTFHIGRAPEIDLYRRRKSSASSRRISATAGSAAGLRQPWDAPWPAEAAAASNAGVAGGWFAARHVEDRAPVPPHGRRRATLDPVSDLAV